MPNSLSSVWGHSVHFANFPSLQFFKICSSPNFRPIHPNFIQGTIIIQPVTFFDDLLKFEPFRNTGSYAAIIFKVLFLPQFSLESIQTL